MGNYQKAEEWHRKELADRGEKDYLAAENFLFFLNRQYRRKASKYAETAKEHYDKETSSFKKSSFGKALKREIDSVLSDNSPGRN